jgi:hypothetical protein
MCTEQQTQTRPPPQPPLPSRTAAIDSGPLLAPAAPWRLSFIEKGFPRYRARVAIPGKMAIPGAALIPASYLGQWSTLPGTIVRCSMRKRGATDKGTITDLLTPTQATKKERKSHPSAPDTWGLIQRTSITEKPCAKCSGEERRKQSLPPPSLEAAWCHQLAAPGAGAVPAACCRGSGRWSG